MQFKKIIVLNATIKKPLKTDITWANKDFNVQFVNTDLF